MLAKILPLILLIVGTGAGIGAGIMMAPEPAADHGMAAAEEEHMAAPTEKMDAGHGAAPAMEGGEHEYIKIPNQFIVPVVERDELTSMVVIALSLETSPGMADKIRIYEPKLRDVFLQVLFDHANMGGFKGAFTRSDVMNPLRTALREAARRQLGNDVFDVLIMDISRQDV
ncbi:flagellar basal body-associated protein FliL [Phaeobacter sp. CAU 1743]|uniref:flagellar basal body-associated protein FliL n=1 Tax=Phaeobacter sp. CAU 1743 TaxID=3140367 RepID=UPI0023B6C63E